MSIETLSHFALISIFSENWQTEKAEMEQIGLPPTHRRECNENLLGRGDSWEHAILEALCWEERSSKKKKMDKASLD